MGTNVSALSSTDVLEALLDVDPELGCRHEVYRANNRHVFSRAVRRTLVQECVRPSITYHDIIVDYDDPAVRAFRSGDFSHIHPALRPEHFPVPHHGRRLVTLVEVYAGYSLSVASQGRLLPALNLRWPCLAEAMSILRSILHRAPYPIMAHCGSAFDANGSGTVVPSLHQVFANRFLDAHRSSSRWSQEYRLLAVAIG